MARESPAQPSSNARDADPVVADDWSRRHAETKSRVTETDARLVRPSSDVSDDWQRRHARVPRS